MGMVVMRGLLALLVLCSITQLGSTQLTFSVGSIGYKVIYPSDDATGPSAICSADGTYDNLAVFESKDDYKELIEKMMDSSDVEDNKKYYIGIMKNAGDDIMRTTSGRPAPVVNFAETKTFNLADDHCVYINLNSGAATGIYGQSLWASEDKSSCLVDGLTGGTPNDGVICMDETDDTCGEECDGSTRDNSDYCFWNPHPYNVFTHLMAKKVCMESGGTLMNLYGTTDINRLTDANTLLVDDKQSYNGYWTGLSQKPKQGVPRWTDGQLIDLGNTYIEDPFNYGSSLMLTQYAGIYDARDEKIQLFNTAPQVDSSDHRYNREAFILCEATHENFCKAVSPEVAHAEKTVSNTDSDDTLELRYTCKAGFMVAPDNYNDDDMDTYQDFDCTCNAKEMAELEVKKCILKNPCYNNPCYGHSYCVFTNEYHKSYYCLCKKGYEMGPDKICRDINECHSNPCGLYRGSCYNTEGSYFCQCSKGYGWDNSGKCSAAGPPGAASMMLYFNVRMDYNSEMNNPASEIYQSIDAALRELVNYVYGSRVNLDSFYISSPSTGTIKIKITLTLYSNMDVKELSHLAYMFYTYTSSSPSFRVGSNTYPYLPGVYFESPSVTKQILVDNICSLYSGLNYCHGSPCVGDGEYPKCSCRYGYEGEYCDNEIGGPDTPYRGDLSSVEIGLIIAVVILFIMVLCMPIIIVCCCIPMRRSYPRAPPPPEYYSPGPVAPPARRFYGVLPGRKFF